jgi:hypothetical protein
MPNPVAKPTQENIPAIENPSVFVAVNQLSLDIYFCCFSPQSCEALFLFLQSSEMGYKPVFENGCINISRIIGTQHEVFLALVQDLEKYFYGIEVFKPDSRFFSILESNGSYPFGNITFQCETSHTFGGGGMTFAARFNDLNLG